MSANVLKALAVTAELTGSEFSKDALRVMHDDLKAYSESVVLHALDRCRKELRGRLTFGAILERIEEGDGRPGADEAWAIAISAQDEAETVVWTDEIAHAFGVAKPILDARDKVGARMAFRDAYERMVRESRLACQPVRWVASIGHDPERRATALSAAVALRRIDAQGVQHMLPGGEGSAVVSALLSGETQALLSAPGLSKAEQKAMARGVDRVRKHLADIERKQAQRAAEEEKNRRSDQEHAARLQAEMRSKVAAFAAERGVSIPGYEDGNG